jgi:hypothetical protein
VADRLVPTYGYWVRASEAGTLDLSGGAGTTAAVASASRAAAEKARLADAIHLSVTDAAGRSAPLYLARTLSGAQRQRYAVPPVPPGETFDVRFADGTRAALADGTTELPMIAVQGASAPVTVRLDWRAAGATNGSANGSARAHLVTLADAAGQVVATLSAEAPVATLSAVPTRLQVAVAPRPAAIALQGSFPNPARERATIGYALPAETDLTIELYDLLGRRVAKLVDGRQPAGMHRVDLDASQLPSGTYFVRMTTGAVIETERLTVVR